MEMTKMLLPTVPTMTNDKFMYYPNYQKRCVEKLLLKLHALERTKRENIIMVVRENYRQILQTNLASNYESQPRIASHEELWCPIITNEERNAKIELKPQLQPEPQPVPELEPQPGPELEPEPKSNSEPEAEPKLISETEIDTESDPTLKLKLLAPESKLTLAEQDWKQECQEESEPDPELECKVFDLENWNYNPSIHLMTSSEIFRIYISSDSEDDSIAKCQMNRHQLSVVLERGKRLRKRRYFLKRENARRMLSTTTAYGNITFHSRSVHSNLARRSLLKSQQNVNNMLLYKNQLVSDNQEKKFCDQNQDCQEKIATPCNRQIMTNFQEKEENQEAEIKQLLNNFDLCKPTDEEPIFRHEQINVPEKLSEYISQWTMAQGPNKNSWKNEVTTNKRIKRHWRKNEENEETDENEENEENENQRQNDIKRNTLSDHCYHLNEPRSPMERLGSNEPSEESEEEEIDVVSFEKHATSNFTRTQRNKTKLAKVDDTSTTLRRPRGRPPSLNSAKRKRDTQVKHVSGPVPKRGRIQNNQRTDRRYNYIQQDENETENENLQRRHMHNNMERERRISLKNLFQELKNCIPEIASNEKVSKVSILKHATNYINDIETYERLLEKYLTLKAQKFASLRQYKN